MKVDADAPGLNKEWRHWIVGNIQHDSSKFEMGSTTITSYNGPTPPPGTGTHRYVFLLYQQPDIHIEFLAVPSARGGFKARLFAEQHGLRLVSANYFLCKNEK